MAEFDDLTVILPTYNEGGNIQSMLESLDSLYPGLSVIVADDNSIDGTRETVLEFAADHQRITLLDRDPSDRGLTASIMDGIANTKTRFFVVMDADFQHPPESVGDLYARLVGGSDMVVGVREDKHQIKHQSSPGILGRARHGHDLPDGHETSYHRGHHERFLRRTRRPVPGHRGQPRAPVRADGLQGALRPAEVPSP